MTTLDAKPSPSLQRPEHATSPTLADARRTPEQVIEGVRRQRRHIMMLDGADPLRGGVAD